MAPAARDYLIVTASYWGFTLVDGALRMVVLLHFFKLGYSPFTLAFLFLLYEFTGIVANVEPSVLSTSAIFTSTFEPVFALLAMLASSLATYAVLFLRKTEGLSVAERAQFENDGYVVVRRLADPTTCAIMLAKARLDLAACVPPVEYEADTGYPGAPASRASRRSGCQPARRLNSPQPWL